jgi:serine/threonine-protein kinase
MTPERWKRIEELYHEADALPAAERAAFLAAACLDDQALRLEVESLLDETPENEGLFGRPLPLTPAASSFPGGPGALTGRTIASYRLQSLLGAGGMGEVYRARDSRLDRDVAVKILPGAFMTDADRVARFAREARMLALVNHPSICAIYGVEEADGIRLLILELVEGQTLAEKLTARRRSGESGLPIDEALAIARQIAEALEVAHEKGIVHRDLKPANIKITADGIVKVLDFGLAKAVAADGSAPDLTQVPASADAGRREGVVMGTAAYMSPEQARGLAVDKRSDIWAFGCVLYEMLTGRVAFAGDTVSDSIAKILEREPDWSALEPSIPAPVRRLLFRSLTKDPKRRLRDIGDARLEIGAIDEVLPGDIGQPPAPTNRARWLSWAAVLALAGGLLGTTGWIFRPLPAPTPTRFTYTLPPGQMLNGSRGAHIVAVSPDGSQMVYSGAPHGLYLRPMSEFGAALIPGTESYEVSEPVFSPDGRSIAFFTIGDQALEKINVTGGAAQTICPVEVVPTGIRWQDDFIIFGQGRNGVMRVSQDGGTPEVLVRVNEGETAYNPQMLPDHRHVLFTLAAGKAPSRWDRAQILVESLSTHQRVRVIDGGSDARYLPSGYILYALAGAMYAAAFDVGKLEVTGERVPVVEGVRRSSGGFTGAALFSLSNNGTLAYVPGPPAGERSAPLDIGLMDRKGEIQPLGLSGGPYARPRVSPDGKRIAFEADDGKEAIVYTYELSGAKTMQRLTTQGNNRFPIWASDNSVAFQSDRGGDEAVWWQALDGSADRLTTAKPGESHAPESWFGDTLLYSVTSKGTDVSLWTYSLRDRKATPFDAKPSSGPPDAVFSPDGRWVAYSTTKGNQMRLYVQGFPSGAAHEFNARPSDTPKHARWSSGGTELCYDPNVTRFECVSVTTEPFAFGNAVSLPKKLQGAPPGERTDYDTTRDGRFLGLITAGHKEFVRGSDSQIHVVVNWFEELKARIRR